MYKKENLYLEIDNVLVEKVVCFDKEEIEKNKQGFIEAYNLKQGINYEIYLLRLSKMKIALPADCFNKKRKVPAKNV